MIFNIITLFPEFFRSPLKTSLIDKAIKKGLIKINIFNLRDFSHYNRKQCDDKPFGGGHGMVLMIEPVFEAIKHIKKSNKNTKVIYFSPQGKVFDQKTAIKFSKIENLTLLCGHYEGIDNRIVENLIDYEITIGDYILTGGEIPTLVFIDVVSRLKSGVVKEKGSIKFDSLYQGLLKYPQYTKPRIFNGFAVPDILLSGNHPQIEKWREAKRIEVTKLKRKDLYKKFIKKEVSK